MMSRHILAAPLPLQEGMVTVLLLTSHLQVVFHLVQLIFIPFCEDSSCKKPTNPAQCV